MEDIHILITNHRKFFLVEPFRCLLNKALHIVKHKHTTIIIIFLLWHLATKNNSVRGTDKTIENEDVLNMYKRRGY
jgi:hypothetical protein